MKAELIDFMGSDDRVVDAARVSFDKIASNYPPEQNQKLLAYLAKHNHWTPFSHVMITMREAVPIFVARQRFKHMVGFTYNEISRRYVDDKPEFYTPSVWRSKPVNAKQGSGTERITELEFDEHLVWDDPNSPVMSMDIQIMYKALLDHAEDLYNLMLKNDVAPEQARMVLPQSMYTSYYVTGSLAAWARAYKLRADAHAQMEIQELAKQWDNIIRGIKELDCSWKALTE